MASTPQNRTDVPAADARSWLLVSAAHSRHFTETHTGAADAVIYDLETVSSPPRDPRHEKPSTSGSLAAAPAGSASTPPAPKTGAATSTHSRQHPDCWA